MVTDGGEKGREWDWRDIKESQRGLYDIFFLSLRKKENTITSCSISRNLS